MLSGDFISVRAVAGGLPADAGARAAGADGEEAGAGEGATAGFVGVSIDSTNIVVRPMTISSPLASTCVLTSLPLTLVPFPEPRSLMRYSSPTFSILACLREDFLSP